jgi:predicted glycosyltransferase
MKIFYYAGHPAQFLFFKNAYSILAEKGHDVCLAIKKKDVLENLVQNSNIPYVNVLQEGRKNSKAGIITGLIKREWRLFCEIRKFRPDLIMGTDPALAHVGKILGIPVITTLEDDYKVIEKLAKITYPFTTNILVPEVCDTGKYSIKKIGYPGYMKLAYLHPSVFQKEEGIEAKYGLTNKYVIIRLASLTAHHDIGIKGINDDVLDDLLNIIQAEGYTPWISAESSTSVKYSKYLLAINPSDMHPVLANASMLICDSQSMSVEAAILGIPSIRYSSFVGRISVLEELEHKYSLTYGIKAGYTEQLLQKTSELLQLNDLKTEFEDRRKKMLSEKINVTEFLVWLIENYPSSKQEILSDEYTFEAFMLKK